MQEPSLAEINRNLNSHISASIENYKDIKNILKEQNEKLEKIEIQTIKTNGRVNQLEKDCNDSKGHVDSLRLWRNLLVGGGIVLAGIGIATITLFLTTYRENLIYETSEQVVNTLEEKYNILIK
jgi:hypothetical protein